MKTFNNEDVFYLIRYALTGNPVGAPIGEIAEVISRKEVLIRVEQAILVF
jgi:glutamyl/glutaminyl-tRNA synthetase